MPTFNILPSNGITGLSRRPEGWLYFVSKDPVTQSHALEVATTSQDTKTIISTPLELLFGSWRTLAWHDGSWVSLLSLAWLVSGVADRGLATDNFQWVDAPSIDPVKLASKPMPFEADEFEFLQTFWTFFGVDGDLSQWSQLSQQAPSGKLCQGLVRGLRRFLPDVSDEGRKALSEFDHLLLECLSDTKMQRAALPVSKAIAAAFEWSLMVSDRFLLDRLLHLSRAGLVQSESSGPEELPMASNWMRLTSIGRKLLDDTHADVSIVPDLQLGQLAVTYR